MRERIGRSALSAPDVAGTMTTPSPRARRRARAMRALAPALVLAVVTLGASGCTGLTRSLTEDELQAHVASRFPLERGFPAARLRLANPRVHLGPGGSDRVGLELDVRAGVLGMPFLVGRTWFEGDLDFRRDRRALYLKNLTIRELDLIGLPREGEIALIGPIEVLGQSVLSRQPLYRVDERRAGRYRLDSAEVRDGKLVLGLRR